MRFAFLIALVGCSERAPVVVKDAARSAAWTITITDEGVPIAGRVLLFDAAGEPVRLGTLDLEERRQATGACLFADDVIGTRDGIMVATGVATIPIGADDCAIPYGRYHVWAWRGPEHERWEGDVDLAATVSTAIALERIASPTGVVADLHVHASASNDSLVPDKVRVVAQVVAGVQVLALSDHNAAGDLDDEIKQLGLERTITSIASNELSGEIHIGVYPWQGDATNLDAATIAELFTVAKAVPGDPIIQLNHPRLRWAALYDDTAWDGATWPPPFPLDFDAVEVLSGDTTFNAPDDRRLDQSLADFYTLIDHGYLVTALGNSDTHHLDGIRDAITRNYVDTTWPITETAFVDAIRRRRVWTTTGPLLDVTVDGAGPGQSISARKTATVSITLRQAAWARVDTVRIRIGRRGPAIAHELPVKPGVTEQSWTVTVALPTSDTWIGVDAIGETPLPTEITGSYLAEEGRPGAAPVALINPILVDVDGDRIWRRKDGRVKLDTDAPLGGRASLRRRR